MCRNDRSTSGRTNGKEQVMNAREMSPIQAEEHLSTGGHFALTGGTMRVLAMPGEGRYVLINDSGNGADHIQGRLSAMLDIMDQYAGGDLSAWEAVS
jgi:hypothetical protein